MPKTTRRKTSPTISESLSADIGLAEKNRSNLRDAYGDILEIAYASAPSAQADIGFHFYESIAKLVRKLQMTSGQPLYQLWTAAEEFRFFFDAHAVWLRVPMEHRSEVHGKTVWEVATLTDTERSILAIVRDGNLTTELLRENALGFRWDVLRQPLGAHPLGIKNSNLAAIDSVLVIDIPSNDGRPAWQLTAFMEHNSRGRRTSRNSKAYCEAILAHGHESLRRALARIPLPFGAVIPTHHTAGGSWPVDRSGFQNDVLRDQDRPLELRQRYRQRFQAIHSVLDRIYDQMDSLLAAEREIRSAETTILFSYRAENEDFVCFFPTVRQLATFVQSEKDVADFLFFWQFKYRRSKAISGWVLATGNSDYTEQFDHDGRWLDWLRQVADDERPAIERQLSLVRRFFRSGDQEQAFMYLIPIVLRQVPADSAAPDKLQPILVVSVGSSKPLTGALRRQLYDLAFQLAPAVEMAIVAQMNLEELYRREIEVKTVNSFAAGFAHEVRQPLNHLALKISGIRAAVQNAIADSAQRQSILDDLDQAKHSVREIHDIETTMLTYAKLREGGGCRLEPVQLNDLLNELIRDFRLYLGAMGSEITIEALLATNVGVIPADRQQLTTMVNNILRNASEALDQTGHIKVSSARTSTVVIITIQDNGPGIPSSVVEKLKRGDRHTSKRLGLGLGFGLISLSCTAHGGAFDIVSQVGVGTSISLHLPTEQPSRHSVLSEPQR